MCLRNVYEWSHRYFVVIDLYKEAIDSGDDLDYQRFYQQQSDVCMLRLFDSFGESAPQLIFYLYVIIGSDFVFKFFSQSSQIFSHKKHWHKNDWIQKLRNLQNFTFWFIELTKTPILLNYQSKVIYDYLASHSSYHSERYPPTKWPQGTRDFKIGLEVLWIQ